MMTMTSNRRPLLNKVPEVTSYFWVIQVLAATAGKTATDLMDTKLTFSHGITSCIMTGMFVAALAFQFRSRRYVPRTYWFSVLMTSVAGTLLAGHLGGSRREATEVLAIALAAILAAWYASQRTLSVRAIFTFRREAFYWLAMLFTFALGTAAAGLVAERFCLGYWRALFLFACLVVVVCVARFRLRFNSVACFWAAYVLTRPLGASLGDLVSQRRGSGGLGFGTTMTLVFLAGILTLMTCLAVSTAGPAGRHARPPSRPSAGYGRYMRYIRRADSE
jgi:uncharacterized membrane-anchored protein